MTFLRLLLLFVLLLSEGRVCGRQKNNNDDDNDRYCRHFIPSITFPGTHHDLLIIIGVILYFLMALVTLIFIQYGKYLGTSSSIANKNTPPISSSSPSIIFPIFEYLLYLQALISILTGIIILIIPIDIGTTNNLSISMIYALIFTLQHLLIEGLAILLSQPGCGNYALSVAVFYNFLWGILCFGFYVIFFEGGKFSLLGQGILDLILLIYYGSLAFFPQSLLYRRPSLLMYAQYWFILRIFGLILHLGFLVPSLEDYCSCGYYFYRIVLFCLFQPILSYQVLFLDSQWWQGLSSTTNNTNTSGHHLHHHQHHQQQQQQQQEIWETTDHQILGEFSLTSAQTLAEVMDQLNSIKNISFLNYTSITFSQSTSRNSFLGDGSFSKVVKGFYQQQSVAIKTILTDDLTTEIIYKIASETKILYLLKDSSPHVVSIYGLLLMPPSICIVLELCQYGSLHNVLRGYDDITTTRTRTRRRSTSRSLPQEDSFLMRTQTATTTSSSSSFCSSHLPFILSVPDMLHLALGAARGVHAIHSFSPFLCHRDIKSFNFLVDSNLTVKIADLELGDDQQQQQQGGNGKRRSSLCKIFDCYNSSGRSGSSPPPPSQGDSSSLEEGLLALNVTQESVSLNSQDHHLDAPPPPPPPPPPSVLNMQATWLAPEVLTTGIFTQSSDIYSLALVLWEIRTKRYPYSHCNFFQTQIRNCVLNGYREPFPVIPVDEIYSESLEQYQTLIQNCWQAEPTQRLTSLMIVQKLESLVRECGKNSLRKVYHQQRNHERRMSAAAGGDGGGGLRSSPTERLIGFLDVGIGVDVIEEESEQEGNSLTLESSPRELEEEEDSNEVQVQKMKSLCAYQSSRTFSHLFHLLESHGSEWISISELYPHKILHISSAFKRSLLTFLPSTADRIPYEEDHLGQLQNEILFENFLKYFSKSCCLSSPTSTSSSAPSSLSDCLSSFLTSCHEIGYGHFILSSSNSSDNSNHPTPTSSPSSPFQIFAFHGYQMTSDSLADIYQEEGPWERDAVPSVESFPPLIAIHLTCLTKHSNNKDLPSSRTQSRSSFGHDHGGMINTIFGNLLGRHSVTSMQQRGSGAGSGAGNESEPLIKEASLDSINFSDC
jgi:hypothetical protein